MPTPKKPTPYEIAELGEIEGCKVIMGIRDCRRLMVAGHPRDFI